MDFDATPEEPHQKWAYSLHKSSQKPLGNWKQFIVYVGIAYVIDLIDTSFPPREKNLSFQPL